MYKKILFATDLSDLSFAAWPHALALAEELGAEVSAMCVIEEPYALAALDQYPVLVKTLLEARPAIEKKLIEATRSHPASVKVTTTVVEAPSPVRALLDHARKERCDLIVVATHGRGGLGHLLLGSVTEKLLRLSPVPVLVVRPPDAR